MTEKYPRNSVGAGSTLNRSKKGGFFPLFLESPTRMCRSNLNGLTRLLPLSEPVSKIKVSLFGIALYKESLIVLTRSFK